MQDIVRFAFKRNKTVVACLLLLTSLMLLCDFGCQSTVYDLSRQSLTNQGNDTSGLLVTYSSHGLERLTWRGQVIEDVNRFPEDTLHIWHMAASNSMGRPIRGPQYVWGENNEGKSWSQSTKTLTYRFVWGEIRVQYQQTGDELDVKVTEENNADSGISLDGASIYPLALHLQGARRAAQLADNLTTPGITLQTFSSGSVAILTSTERNQIYSGCEQSSTGGVEPACSILISSVLPDSLNHAQQFLIKGKRPPVSPGHTDTFQLSLRFSPPDTPLEKQIGDAARSWSRRWPATLRWVDRRPIGTVYLASSPRQGTPTLAPNPRRYFVTDKVPDIDTQTPTGLKMFQSKLLSAAKAVTVELTRLNAQGVIIWDIEGEQYPQTASYVCAPDQIAVIAPEMDSRVADRSSEYFGMKLSDAYFKTIRDAGFRVGLCVRPQHFSIGADHTARQETMPDEEATAELVRKMRYAHQRWGATLFYLDSTVDKDGRTLDPSIIERAAAALPDSLLIPEESSLRMYRATAPFQTFIFHGDKGTSDYTKVMFPSAFSVNLINDADPARLAADRKALEKSVHGGDIMMVHADDWPPANDFVKQLYLSSKATLSK